jgi:hypothetical protein
VLYHDIAKIFVCESPDDVKHGCIWYIKESEKEHPENVFQFWIPVTSEEFFENIDKSFRKYLFGFSLFDRERIETKWMFLICRIKYDDIVFSLLGDMHHDFFDEVTVRVDDRESLTIRDVINHL